jgi:exonuclease SbcC
LAAELDEVLEQASRRLEVMSRGRFILKRAQEIDDKRRNAGLDLTIEDSFTGTSRPAAYLSGGESFLASLALALGLADVVQSTLGGVRLEAVFVDEGFGTLDPETLELAMKVLSDLQVGGRIVGVISHVPELREQISERLVVRKSPTGSTTEWERP